MPVMQVSPDVVPWDFCFSASTESLADEEGSELCLDSFMEELEAFCRDDEDEDGEGQTRRPFLGAYPNEPQRKLRMQ